jgi:hypothetical protein
MTDQTDAVERVARALGYVLAMRAGVNLSAETMAELTQAAIAAQPGAAAAGEMAPATNPLRDALREIERLTAEAADGNALADAVHKLAWRALVDTPAAPPASPGEAKKASGGRRGTDSGADKWNAATPVQTDAENCGACHQCIREHDIKGPSGLPLDSERMILCPTCGNKRCPKASDHRLACTNSNESGQPGSIYTRPVVLTPTPTPPAGGDVTAAEAKHTPGPWRVRAEKGLWWTIEAELPSINGLPCWYTVARCDFDRAADGYTDGALNPEADAHLIARAPELATALAAERAEAGRLRQERDKYRMLTSEASTSLVELEAERDEARAESERLRAALDEIANVAAEADKGHPQAGFAWIAQRALLTTPAPASDGIRQGGELEDLAVALVRACEAQQRCALCQCHRDFGLWKHKPDCAAGKMRLHLSDPTESITAAEQRGDDDG